MGKIRTMAETPTVGSEGYQDLDAIRQRVDYGGSDLFNDNAALRFDQLLVRLEEESRGIFETLWGDQTPLTEEGRIDEKRATDDAAMLLVYPINDVTKVERKTTMGSDWKTLDSDWWDFTEHRLVLARRPNTNTLRHRQRGNPLTANANRSTWRDIASKIRVTYDRGFGSEPPADIKSIQISLINRMLRNLKGEQTVAAASPDELAGVASDFDATVTDEIRDRVADVTSPGGATMSV